MPVRSKRERLWIVLGILWFFLTNYPLLQIFNLNTLLSGIPVLAVYLFGVWILAIALLYVCMHFFS
jgi:hypothetical protein